MALALPAGHVRRSPCFHDEMVRRPHLVRALRATRHAPLALVVSPAGYGKSTLLTEWAQDDERPFAWVTVDTDNRDPEALLAAVAGALDDVACTAGDVFDALASPDPFVLVVDDAHRLRAGAMPTLAVISRQLAPGSTLAVASRSEPRLGLGRMRAHRLVVEVRACDLAMTRTESAVLLDKSGVALDRAAVERIHARTEGWPAALHLAALAARDQADPAEVLAGFGGDDRIVADYLQEEVLDQLPSATAAFLVDASVLDCLSGPACDAVLRRTGSGELLRSLVRDNFPLTPLDRHDSAYRMHPLLAQMLRAQLTRTRRGREAELRARASAWHEDRGELDEAIEHAVTARDGLRAGALLTSAAPAYLSVGRAAALERWLLRFTDAEVAASPGLALTAAATHLVAGDRDRVEHFADAAAAALLRVPREATPSLRAGVAAMHASVAREGVGRMSRDAGAGFAMDADPGPWRPLCRLLEGVSAHLQGETATAAALLDEAARHGARGAPFVGALALAQLGLLAIERDNWSEAATLSARARATARRGGIAGYPTCALVHAVSALVGAHRECVEDAQAAREQAERLLSLLAGFTPWYEAETHIVLARAALRLSDVAAARAALTEADRLLRGTQDAPTLSVWLADAWARADAYTATAADGSSLTTAELRVLRLLPSHLSFREIGNHVHVSINTVKTQAHAVYRKLDACSRAEAVSRAQAIGLLD